MSLAFQPKALSFAPFPQPSSPRPGRLVAGPGNAPEHLEVVLPQPGWVVAISSSIGADGSSSDRGPNKRRPAENRPVRPGARLSPLAPYPPRLGDRHNGYPQPP